MQQSLSVCSGHRKLSVARLILASNATSRVPNERVEIHVREIFVSVCVVTNIRVHSYSHVLCTRLIRRGGNALTLSTRGSAHVPCPSPHVQIWQPQVLKNNTFWSIEESIEHKEGLHLSISHSPPYLISHQAWLS